MKPDATGLRHYEVDFCGYLFFVKAANEKQARYRAWKSWNYPGPEFSKPPFREFLTARIVEWQYNFAPSWADERG